MRSNSIAGNCQRAARLRDEGLTPPQIAQRMGLSVRRIRHYLNTYASPNPDELDRAIIPADIPKRHQNYFLLVAHEQGIVKANEWTRTLMADEV